jgi:hypothetical protein
MNPSKNLRYDENELIAERESARDRRRLRAIGIDPDADPVDIMVEVFAIWSRHQNQAHQINDLIALHPDTGLPIV